MVEAEDEDIPSSLLFLFLFLRNAISTGRTVIITSSLALERSLSSVRVRGRDAIEHDAESVAQVQKDLNLVITKSLGFNLLKSNF